MKDETILNRITAGSDNGKAYYNNGANMSGGVYINNEEHWDFIAEIMRLNITSNPLHVLEFSYINQLESEILRMTLDLYNAPKDACGITTSGGTESILMAILAYREYAKKNKGVTSPNLVMS